MSDSKSLLSLVSQASAIEEMLIVTGGELTPEIEAALALTDVQLPAKIDNYSLVMERMESISDHYRARADMFLRMAKAADAVVDRCKSNLKSAMETMQVTELQGFDVRFALVKSNPSVVVEDESALDAAYKTEVTTFKINKKKLGEDLKLGVPVPGARIVQGYSLRQYANTPAKKAVKA